MRASFRVFASGLPKSQDYEQGKRSFLPLPGGEPDGVEGKNMKSAKLLKAAIVGKAVMRGRDLKIGGSVRISLLGRVEGCKPMQN
jgi:hypothetical protein